MTGRCVSDWSAKLWTLPSVGSVQTAAASAQRCPPHYHTCMVSEGSWILLHREWGGVGKNTGNNGTRRCD